MKLEIEIKNDMVQYKYYFAESCNGGGSMPLSQELLGVFLNATHYMQEHYRYEKDRNKEKILNDIQCRAWIEKNPLEFVEMLERIAKQEPKAS